MKWEMKTGLPRTQYNREFRERSVKFPEDSGLTLIIVLIACVTSESRHIVLGYRILQPADLLALL